MLQVRHTISLTAQISTIGNAADVLCVALLHIHLSPCCRWWLHITDPSAWLLYQFTSPAVSLWVAVNLRQFDNQLNQLALLHCKPETSA